MVGYLVIAVVGLAALYVMIKLVRAGAKVEAEMTAAEQSAVPREATVLSVYVHPSSNMNRTSAALRRDMHLRVHIPDGDDYTTCNTWRVRGDIEPKEGETVAVTVHPSRPDIVFPAVAWLRYDLADYAEKLYRRRPGVGDL